MSGEISYKKGTISVVQRRAILHSVKILHQGDIEYNINQFLFIH